jgi:hypothetical protein
MSRPVNELIKSIIDDFAAAKQSKEELEAKALFRLLNYCTPRAFDINEPPYDGDQITG